MLDEIAETLARASDASDRAAVVLALVAEIHATAAWLAGERGSAELYSLDRVVTEARAHHTRMTTPYDGGATGTVGVGTDTAATP
jgi:hypothetical protein